jgi:uncharacterized membrane protein YvbJ
MAFCDSCGRELSEGWHFCRGCGASTLPPATVPATQARLDDEDQAARPVSRRSDLLALRV